MKTEEKISDVIPVEAVQERDTDLLLLEEIKSNVNFTDWLLSKTIGLGGKYQLIDAWHSLTQVGLGESDIVFKVLAGEKVVLFFVENKIDASFQPDQAKRYRLRGEQMKANGDCAEYYTVLFAPKKYIGANLDFDFSLEYEIVRDWFLNQTSLGPRAQFKADILTIAIEKLRRGYTPIINEAVTDFRWAYFNYSKSHFPHLNMSEPKKEMPKRTGFIRFKPVGMDLKKNEFIIHKKRGDVDIQLRRGFNLSEMIEKYGSKLSTDMEIADTGKSTSIRMKVPAIDIEGNFETQLTKVILALKTVEKLFEWGKANLQK